MDRRSFLLASLLPIVAAKGGLFATPLRASKSLFVPWFADRKFSILTLKARSIGMSTLVHNRMVAAQTAMSRRLAQDIWNNGFKRDDVADRLLMMKSKYPETGRWTFVYLGSNQDLSKIQQDLNIPKGNTQTFVNTPAGYAQAFTMTNKGLSNYMSSRARGVTCSSSFYSETGDPIEKPVQEKGQSSVITDKPPKDDDQVSKFYDKTG